MEEPIQPLPRSIYDKAKAHGIKEITLLFRGGDDSGYLNVEFEVGDNEVEDGFFFRFQGEVEAWAWEVYEYSGAGEGVDYGDNITYDLVKNKVTTRSWFYEKQYATPELSKLEITDGDKGEDE